MKETDISETRSANGTPSELCHWRKCCFGSNTSYAASVAYSDSNLDLTVYDRNLLAGDRVFDFHGVDSLQ